MYPLVSLGGWVVASASPMPRTLSDTWGPPPGAAPGEGAAFWVRRGAEHGGLTHVPAGSVGLGLGGGMRDGVQKGPVRVPAPQPGRQGQMGPCGREAHVCPEDSPVQLGVEELPRGCQGTSLFSREVGGVRRPVSPVTTSSFPDRL